MLEAGSPHWRRSRIFRNQSEEHNARVYAEFNLMVKGKETFEKEDKDDGKKKTQRSSRREMGTED